MIRVSSLEKPYRTSFTNGRHSAVADVPLEKGGADEGFGPHELLEAALATCLTMTVQMYAAKHGLPLTAAHCAVRLDRSVPNDFVLHYDLVLDGPLGPDETEQLREAARNCPVGRTISSAPRLVAASRSGVAST